MTSRERVRRCVEFERPDRPPRDLWVLPLAEKLAGRQRIDELRRRWPGDFTQSPGCRPAGRLVRGDPAAVGQFRDEWGCIFENIQEGAHGEVKSPILDDWSKLEDVRPPRELLEVDREAVNAFCRGTDKFVFASGWARPFERVQFIRGSENVFMDLAEDAPELHELLRRVHGFFVEQYQVWAATEVDALVMMDDWGSQRSLLIHPEQWRRVFKPLYAQYVRIAHDHGKKFFMHCDGQIMDIYPDLVEIGVDAINSQLFCMDVEDLGRRFAGRITFWGEIDRQDILPRGSEAQVRAAVRRVVENLWRPEGGAIAQFELTPGMPMENAEAVYDEWRRLTG